MRDVLERADDRHYLGVRLVLASYHARALSLYAKLGFTVRDISARVTGAPLARQSPAHTVRSATLADLDACNQVCWRVHGHDRRGELQDAITQGSATVVEHEGRLSVTGHEADEGWGRELSRRSSMTIPSRSRS
jgi:hypothetical protein